MHLMVHPIGGMRSFKCAVSLIECAHRDPEHRIVLQLATHGMSNFINIQTVGTLLCHTRYPYR